MMQNGRREAVRQGVVSGLTEEIWGEKDNNF
jgi:hypothetical protein